MYSNWWIFLIANDAPMNEYSDLSDFSDDEWEEFDYEEYDWEGEDHSNVDEVEVKNESIKYKYLLIE